MPVDMVPRGGLAWGELDEARRAALIDLLGSVLSAEGLRIVREQMAADDVLAAEQEEGGGGERQLHFGSDYYYVSFLGAAASTSPWMLQFGGHHFAINATVVGPHVSLSPSLTVGPAPQVQIAGGGDRHRRGRSVRSRRADGVIHGGAARGSACRQPAD